MFFKKAAKKTPLNVSRLSGSVSGVEAEAYPRSAYVCRFKRYATKLWRFPRRNSCARCLSGAPGSHQLGSSACCSPRYLAQGLGAGVLRRHSSAHALHRAERRQKPTGDRQKRRPMWGSGRRELGLPQNATPPNCVTSWQRHPTLKHTCARPVS